MSSSRDSTTEVASVDSSSTSSSSSVDSSSEPKRPAVVRIPTPKELLRPKAELRRPAPAVPLTRYTTRTHFESEGLASKVPSHFLLLPGTRPTAKEEPTLPFQPRFFTSLALGDTTPKSARGGVLVKRPPPAQPSAIHKDARQGIIGSKGAGKGKARPSGPVARTRPIAPPPKRSNWYMSWMQVKYRNQFPTPRNLATQNQ